MKAKLADHLVTVAAVGLLACAGVAAVVFVLATVAADWANAESS